MTSELMAAAMEQLAICPEPQPLSAHERIARLAMEVENLRAVLANRKGDAHGRIIPCQECCPEFGCFDGSQPCRKQPIRHE
jgi:hypothetical protein